jgi:hypothetical protein
MTAIRNFPNAPLAQRTKLPISAYVPAWATAIWHGLYRVGQRRAARELDMLADRSALGDPVLARQLRAAAAECRRAEKVPPTPSEGSLS